MRQAFTLLELLIVIAIVAVLAGLTLPAISAIHQQARLQLCASRLHGLHVALTSYAVANDRCMPPFAFSSMAQPSLPVSGHWGGTERAHQPDMFGSALGKRATAINLWCLVQEDYVARELLFCPSSDRRLQDGTSSMFAFSGRFSSYCLRFPFSEDVFHTASDLAWRYGHLLGIYEGRATGKQADEIGFKRVPQLRMGDTFRIDLPDAPGDGVFNSSDDTILADGFWWQDHCQPAKEAESYPVRASWSHGPKFNVLRGSGSVHTLVDSEDVIRSNTVGPGQSYATDPATCNAQEAETVWQYFDGKL